MNWRSAPIERGVYRGQCAEFCGLQHAHMAMLVIAEDQPAFDAFARRQSEAAVAPPAAFVPRMLWHVAYGCGSAVQAASEPRVFGSSPAAMVRAAADMGEIGPGGL
jgi:heme/copper-type cytochrome/quinol oxidase subunit 2